MELLPVRYAVSPLSVNLCDARLAALARGATLWLRASQPQLVGRRRGPHAHDVRIFTGLVYAATAYEKRRMVLWHARVDLSPAPAGTLVRIRTAIPPGGIV